MKLTLIRLTEIDMCEARRRATEIASHPWIRDTDNYTGLASPDRWLVGCMGEIACHKWAEQEQLMYFETTNTSGRPDTQDFIFEFKDGRSARVNVKNSMHPRARYLMQPEDQAVRHTDQDVYIGASGEYDGDEAVIRLWGAIPRLHFLTAAARVMRDVRTLQFPLAKLPHTMQSFAYQTAKKSMRRH